MNQLSDKLRSHMSTSQMTKHGRWVFLKHPNARIEFPNSSARYVPEKRNTPLLQASVITVQFIVEDRLRNDEFNREPQIAHLSVGQWETPGNFGTAFARFVFAV